MFAKEERKHNYREEANQHELVLPQSRSGLRFSTRKGNLGCKLKKTEQEPCKINLNRNL
jgi:hypothetical protein